MSDGKKIFCRDIVKEYLIQISTEIKYAVNFDLFHKQNILTKKDIEYLKEVRKKIKRGIIRRLIEEDKKAKTIK